MKRGPVAKVDQIPEGTTLQVVVEGEGVLLCRCGGELYAIEDVCTHDGGALDQGRLQGCTIECPRHGAQFDVRTGEVLALPAIVGVATYPVTIEGDDVYVEI